MECFKYVFDADLRQFYVYNFWLLSLCQTIDLLAAILNNRQGNVTLIFGQLSPFFCINRTAYSEASYIQDQGLPFSRAGKASAVIWDNSSLGNQ